MTEAKEVKTSTELPTTDNAFGSFLNAAKGEVGGGSILMLALSWAAGWLWLRRRTSKEKVDGAVDNATVSNLGNILRERDQAVKDARVAMLEQLASATERGRLIAENKALDERNDELREEADDNEARRILAERDALNTRAELGRQAENMRQLMAFCEQFLPKDAVALMHARVYEVRDITRELLDEQGRIDRTRFDRLGANTGAAEENEG